MDRPRICSIANDIATRIIHTLPLSNDEFGIDSINCRVPLSVSRLGSVCVPSLWQEKAKPTRHISLPFPEASLSTFAAFEYRIRDRRTAKAFMARYDHDRSDRCSSKHTKTLRPGCCARDEQVTTLLSAAVMENVFVWPSPPPLSPLTSRLDIPGRTLSRGLQVELRRTQHKVSQAPRRRW